MKKVIIAVIVLILVITIILCNLNNESESEVKLEPIDSIALKVPEPSGLYFDESDNSLWTVSDDNSTIYKLDLKGNIKKQILVDGFDLEGITKINDSTLCTILERDRAVVIIDTSGNELKRFVFDLQGEPNKGLEGVTFNKEKNSLYILNEKQPGLLIETDLNGNILNKNQINFALDFSGITITQDLDELWITSDEDEKILKTDLSGEVVAEYKTNIEQIEGIAIDQKNKLLYIISDPLEKLYIYNLP